MNNEQILIKAALDSGKFTQKTIDDYLSSGEEIPFHTLPYWNHLALERGIIYKVRDGEKGHAAKIWRKKQGKEKNMYYLAKVYLYTESQLEAERIENYDRY